MQFPRQPAKAESSSRLPRFLGHRFVKRCLWIAAVGAVLVCLFYAEENWRGKSAWNSCRKTLVAKGVDLDWHKLIPPSVDDGENFAATPFFAALFDFAPGTHTPRDMAAYNRTAGFAQTGEPYMEQRGGNQFIPGMFARQFTDLAAARANFETRKTHAKPPITPNAKVSATERASEASALLETLAKFNPILNELRSASRKPKSRFNLDYKEENTWRAVQPHLPVLNRVCIVLTERASAELARGDASPAAEDVDLIITLANSIRDEPFAPSYRARVGMLADARQVIWEGLAAHVWSNAQLEHFQARFDPLTLIHDALKPVRLEQSAINQLFDSIHRNRAMVRSWTFGPGLVGTFVAPYFLWLMPDGWLYREQASFHHSILELIPDADASSERIQPQIIHHAVNGRFALLNHHVLSDAFLQSFESQLTLAALAETGRNQTILACALERYRLANRRFPESLAALSPHFVPTIPLDPINAQPMKYRPEDANKFVLYSLGWNARDDNGSPAMNKDNRTINPTSGDWVWPQYPEE